MTFTPEQLTERRAGVGASEIGAILGLDPFRTALDVYLDKRGELPPFEGNDDTMWGTLVEPVIVQFYQHKFPDRIIEPAATYRHRSISWAFATPDRMVRDGTAGRYPLECKNKGFFTSRDFGEANTDQIPDNVAAQAYWQMLVTEADQCDIAAGLAGKPPQFFRVERDEAVLGRIVEVVTTFWEKNVALGIPPVPGARDYDTLKRLFPASHGVMLDGTPDLYETLGLLAEAKAEAKQLESEIGDLEGPIKLAIGENDGLLFPDGSKVTWKSNKPSTVTDWEAVAQQLSVHVDAETAARILVECTRSKPGARQFRPSFKGGA